MTLRCPQDPSLKLRVKVKSFNISIVLEPNGGGFYGVTVSTVGFEPVDPSSNLGRTFLILNNQMNLT